MGKRGLLGSWGKVGRGSMGHPGPREAWQDPSWAILASCSFGRIGPLGWLPGCLDPRPPLLLYNPTSRSGFPLLVSQKLMNGRFIALAVSG